jgi:hypothetical protein
LRAVTGRMQFGEDRPGYYVSPDDILHALRVFDQIAEWYDGPDNMYSAAFDKMRAVMRKFSSYCEESTQKAQILEEFGPLRHTRVREFPVERPVKRRTNHTDEIESVG